LQESGHYAVKNNLINGEQWCLEPGKAAAEWRAWVSEKTAIRSVDSEKQSIDPVVLEKAIGNFKAVFNWIRGLKVGAGKILPLGVQPSLPESAAACGMECQIPSAKFSVASRAPQVLISGSRLDWAAIPNLAPFSEHGHWMLLPVTHGKQGINFVHTRQELTKVWLEEALELTTALPEAVVFFNGLHAGASQNHLHFQLVFEPENLPIEAAERMTLSGVTCLMGYPAGAVVYDSNSLDSLWMAVAKLQARGVPLNLILRHGCAYLVGRVAEHEVTPEYPCAIPASYEFAGKWIVPSKEFFDSLTAEIAETVLRKASYTSKQLVALVS